MFIETKTEKSDLACKDKSDACVPCIHEYMHACIHTYIMFNII